MTVLSGRRLLVLEDEPVVGLALEDMLADAGAVTLFAQSLETASRLINTEVIDAAILDINIHGSLSYPIAEELAERAVPYIFATGYGDVLHGSRYEAVPTVTKPYNFADIERCLGAAGLR